MPPRIHTPSVNAVNEYGRPLLTHVVWEDEVVGGASIRPGATAPPAKDYLGTRLLHFAIGDEASVTCQMSHGWALTDVEPHVHIGLSVAAANPARIQFRAEGMRSAEGLVGNTWGPVDTEVIVSSAAQYYEIKVDFGLLDMSGFAQESAIVGWKLTRIAASANEYNGGTADAALLSGDCHIEKNSMGTHQHDPPFTK